MFIAGFVHLDVTHVLFNANSVIEAGVVMEPHMGAVPFLLDASMLILLAHGIYVSAAWIEKEKLGLPTTYYSKGRAQHLGIVSMRMMKMQLGFHAWRLRCMS